MRKSVALLDADSRSDIPFADMPFFRWLIKNRYVLSGYFAVAPCDPTKTSDLKAYLNECYSAGVGPDDSLDLSGGSQVLRHAYEFYWQGGHKLDIGQEQMRASRAYRLTHEPSNGDDQLIASYVVADDAGAAAAILSDKHPDHTIVSCEEFDEVVAKFVLYNPDADPHFKTNVFNGPEYLFEPLDRAKKYTADEKRGLDFGFLHNDFARKAIWVTEQDAAAGIFVQPIFIRRCDVTPPQPAPTESSPSP